MKKNLSRFVLLIFVCAFPCLVFAQGELHVVSPEKVHEGYEVTKIWLKNYARPKITVSSREYLAIDALPNGQAITKSADVEVQLGMDRKRPFAVVRVPIYRNSGGQIEQLITYNMDFTEVENGKKTTGSAVNYAQHSVLSKGTWYKIGITKTGVYKLDKSFFTSLGIDVTTLNTANIRIFGNGAHMLSEDNSIGRPDDLLENALWVNDRGDNLLQNDDFVAFYGVGPTAWLKDSVNQGFRHQNNLYTDTAYYFVTVDNGAGARVTDQLTALNPTVAATGLDFYAVHDTDLVNRATFAKTWYGEQFIPDAGNTTQSFNFDLGAIVTDLKCRVDFSSTSGTAGSSVMVAMNNVYIGSATFASGTTDEHVMTHVEVNAPASCSSTTAVVSLTFNPSDFSTSIGYLDFIELNARRPLAIIGSQMGFRDWRTVGPDNVAGFTLQNANANTIVWDVTTPNVPVKMKGSVSGSSYSFSQNASSLHEFIAMNDNNFMVPKVIGQISNQDIHGQAQPKLIIVTYPDYIDAANRIAAYHSSTDKMQVLVATTTQVYNEFSSGGQDISAIRDMARMFYKKAGTDSTKLPKYLLLLGGASYDYKNRVPANTNFVPVFEAMNDTDNLNGFSTDDFYGFLDDSEYIENTNIANAMDVGVGRLPARTLADANAIADKIINYRSAASLGPWRTSAMFTADNSDNAGPHFDDAELMSTVVNGTGKALYNEQKVYIDAIPTISTPAGPRCPNANSSINEQIYKGTFMVNYNGHGNTEVWATERILTSDDYNNWTNANKLPFMVTATCDFGQFDHPQYVSAAEQLLMKSGGGTIAMITTTQAVYSDYNRELNQQYLNAQFTKNSDGTWNTFGDASRIGKNATYITSKNAAELANFRKFSLLGDPALTPDFPAFNVRVDSVIDGYDHTMADTVKALGLYLLKGHIADNDSMLLPINGNIYVSFYDKPRSVTVATYYGQRTFKVQDNLIYRGKVSVVNGYYELTFIAPKDINYYFGAGKISTYADNGIIDAAGCDSGFYVGGFSDHPIINSAPPVVKAFINDSLFIDGGVTGSNTSLFLELSSVTGINVSGYAIGHDLIAILDGNQEQPYVLNDYYETAPNTFKQGYVNFPLLGLATGKHTITVKAWDVNNNAGEGAVDFQVVDSKVADIQNLGNYPNPFNGTTHFVFEHNHPDEPMTVQICIFSQSGTLVKKISDSFTPTGSRTADITWDGTATGGLRLPSGVYVYRLELTTEKGYKASAYQKLVIER